MQTDREPFDQKWITRGLWFYKLVESTRFVCKGRTFLLFGYFRDDSESPSSRAYAAAYEATEIPLYSRTSTLWQVSGISAMQKKGWVIFMREQTDLTENGLKDFGNDCCHYLEHLVEEAQHFAVPE